MRVAKTQKKQRNDLKKTPKYVQKKDVEFGTDRIISHEHEKLLQWFQTVKFRKTLFGGVDEAYLWKKLEELNGLYETALVAERARYDALLEKQKRDFDAIYSCNKDLKMQGQAELDSKSAGRGFVPDGKEQK